MMNICSIEAGLAEIADKAFIDFSRSENAKARKLLCKALDELGIEYLRSQTNFVFMNLKAPLKPFAERMKAEHILVGRPFPPAVEWCRVSLGTPAETAYFVKKLREFRQKGCNRVMPGFSESPRLLLQKKSAGRFVGFPALLNCA